MWHLNVFAFFWSNSGSLGLEKNSLNLIKYPSGVTELQFGAKFVVRIPREGQRKCSNATPMLVPHFLPYLVKD